VTKLKKSGKLKAPGLVYVSVLLDPDTAAHQVWVKKFRTRLSVEIRSAQDRFEDVAQTTPGTAGDLGGNVHAFRSPVSAFVGVLNDLYLDDNLDSKKVAKCGELACLFDRTLAATIPTLRRDPEIEIHIFLAPLDDVEWSAWTVRGIRLDDARLTRLRDEPFLLPYKDEIEAKRQIDAAARRVVIDAQDAESELQ